MGRLVLNKEEADGMVKFRSEDGVLFLDPLNYARFLEYTKSESKKNPLQRFITMIVGVGSKPVQGKIMLIKETFMFYKKKRELFKNPPTIDYYPHKFGPYSKEIVIETKVMQRKGILESKDGAIWLSPMGVKIFADIASEYSKEELESLKSYRIGLDELSTDGIMKFVYENYIEYTVNSKVKEKYLKQHNQENA